MNDVKNIFDVGVSLMFVQFVWMNMFVLNIVNVNLVFNMLEGVYCILWFVFEMIYFG